MRERFGEMEKAVVAQSNECKPSGERIRPSDRDLSRRLGEYPDLNAKIENVLALDCLIATFCLEAGHSLLHRGHNFDPFESLLALRVISP